jgi:hypothetical protein
MTDPISLNTPTTFEAGATINCQVAVSGVPSSIHIYSDPPGVVSYSGTISGTTATVPVQTNPDATSGDVTVYLSTGGSQVVADTAVVENPNQPEGPQ